MSEPQSLHRLWWVATYHDGTTIYESERAGEVSSEDVSRTDLKRFSLVDADGVEAFGLDFPAGDDPKLVYRRRSFVGPAHELPEPFVRDENGYEVPNPDCPEHLRERPDWLKWKWTYIVGRHHRSGRLELWSLNPETGGFEQDTTADVALVPCEEFA